MKDTGKVIFDKLGSSYDKAFCEERHRRMERFMRDENTNRHWKVQKKNVLELLDPQPGDTFLDIGCGHGKYETFISPITRITALDISEDQLAGAADLVRQFGNSENVTFKKFQPPLRDLFPQEKFNKIFMIDSSEHMPLHIFHEILEDIKKLLTQDGCLAIYTPNKSHFMERIKPVSMTGHINVMTMEDMLKALNEIGFVILKKYYRYSHLPVLGTLERYIPLSLFKRRLCIKAQLQKT